VIRSAVAAIHRNRRVSFKSDVQKSLKLFYTKPSLTFVWKDSHHKHKSRRNNNDVSNRNRSKADYTDQHISSRTWSKMHNLNYSSIQNLFFSLYDAILLQRHKKFQAQDILINTKSQVDFDCLLQIFMLDKTEEDNDMFWEYHKVVEYCKEK
jgi:hypothetical protein